MDIKEQFYNVDKVLVTRQCEYVLCRKPAEYQVTPFLISSK